MIYSFYCKSCGSKVGSDSEYCPNCGKIFSAVRCPKCNFTGDYQLFEKGCPQCHHGVGGKKDFFLSRKWVKRLMLPLLFLLLFLLYKLYCKL